MPQVVEGIETGWLAKWAFQRGALAADSVGREAVEDGFFTPAMFGFSLGTTYFVDLTSGNDANDGKTWATAKKTLQAAIDLCVAGNNDIIYWTGSVTVTTSILLNKANVWLIGVPAQGPITGGNQSITSATEGLSVIKVTAVKTRIENLRITINALTGTGIELATNVVSQGVFRNIDILVNGTDTGDGLKFTTVPSACLFENIKIRGASQASRAQHGIVGASNKCHYRNIYVQHTEGQGIYNAGSVDDVFEHLVLAAGVATGLEIVATAGSDSIINDVINNATILLGGAHACPIFNMPVVYT